MFRSTIYSTEQGRSFDFLWFEKDAMAALGALEVGILGTNTTVLDGLVATPTGPASLTINLSAGHIYQQAAADSTAWGSLASDSTVIQQQGVAPAQTVTLSTTGLSAGQSRWALVEATFSQVDAVRTGDPTGGLLYYYNSVSPSTPFQGVGGGGVTQNTVRESVCTISVIYGSVATTGSEVPPSPSAGNVPMYLIDLVFGQTAITSGQILVAGPSVGTNVPSNYPGAPFIAGLLNSHHSGAAGSAPQIKLTSEVQGILPYANMSLVRIPLVANATFYVNASTGNDSTGNGTSGAPWQTLGHARNVVQQTLDLAGLYGVTFICTGSFSNFTPSGQLVGQVGVGSEVWEFTAGSSIAGVGVQGFALLTLQSVSGFVTLTGPVTTALNARSGAQVALGAGINFGTSVLGCVQADTLGTIYFNGNFEVSGSSVSFLTCIANGLVQFTSLSAITGTLIGSPVFTNSFFNATNGGTIIIPSSSVTWSGSAGATTPRYNVSHNGWIDTGGGGASYLPGTTAGSGSNYS